MSRTLPLAEGLYGLARLLRSQGRVQEAAELLRKLIERGGLPPRLAADVHSDLANIHYEQEDYVQARRHLHVALAHQPRQAELHFRMAKAIEDDPFADPERAQYHYRRAMSLAPRCAEYRREYGRFMVHHGRAVSGIRHLTQAANIAEEDISNITDVALRLAEAGDFRAARRVALHALFRNPDDHRLKQLWNDLRFREARHEQLAAQADPSSQPMLLPFVSPRRHDGGQGRRSTGGVASLRVDPAATPAGPHTTRRTRKRQSR